MSKVNVSFKFNGDYDVVMAGLEKVDLSSIFEAAHRRLDSKIRRTLGVSRGKLVSKKIVQVRGE